MSIEFARHEATCNLPRGALRSCSGRVAVAGHRTAPPSHLPPVTHPHVLRRPAGVVEHEDVGLLRVGRIGRPRARACRRGAVTRHNDRPGTSHRTRRQRCGLHRQRHRRPRLRPRPAQYGLRHSGGRRIQGGLLGIGAQRGGGGVHVHHAACACDQRAGGVSAFPTSTTRAPRTHLSGSSSSRCQTRRSTRRFAWSARAPPHKYRQTARCCRPCPAWLCSRA